MVDHLTSLLYLLLPWNWKTESEDVSIFAASRDQPISSGSNRFAAIAGRTGFAQDSSLEGGDSNRRSPVRATTLFETVRRLQQFLFRDKERLLRDSVRRRDEGAQAATSWEGHLRQFPAAAGSAQWLLGNDQTLSPSPDTTSADARLWNVRR
jgi:hypothetical protein